MKASPYGVLAYSAFSGLKWCKARCKESETGSMSGRRVSVVKTRGFSPSLLSLLGAEEFCGREDISGGR